MADTDPTRDHHPGCEHEGIGGKYTVARNDGAHLPGGRHDGCEYLVLDLTHDPSARFAARIYLEDIADNPGRARYAAGLEAQLIRLGAVPAVPLRQGRPQPLNVGALPTIPNPE
jgi:hypothetical protein